MAFGGNLKMSHASNITSEFIDTLRDMKFMKMGLCQVLNHTDEFLEFGRNEIDCLKSILATMANRIEKFEQIESQIFKENLYTIPGNTDES